ncbi:MAG: primosomal protein N' [Alistipes sp.]|nr:primosomal protein N' [Alistipes sp.]
MMYADIVLPLAQPAYTFAVPEGMELRCGDAVAVQFGQRYIYTGIVWRLHGVRPDFKRVKSVGARLYDVPLLDERQMRFWEWMADYYMCTLGEVMRMALPSMAKPRGRSEEEFSAEVFRPRTEQYVVLAEAWRDAGALSAECDRIRRRAPRRCEALEALAAFGDEGRTEDGAIPRRLLDIDGAVLAALRKGGYVDVTERERRAERGGYPRFAPPRLTEVQARAADEIRASWASGVTTHLLRGVTGSGKTEIYMNLMAETLASGGDVLMLVPEIAFTAQLVERMERVFGSRVTAYHSKLTVLRRTETYMRLLHSEGGELVVGTRSALFLPLRRLRMIVVDEEHDPSYKQSDTAPRYNARDCAVVLASTFGGRVLLGSATPSLESYANALWHKYGYSVIEERYGGARQPDIIVSDTMRAVKRGERRSHFNIELIRAMEGALSRGEQVMLFQNRRGFSPFVSCRECGWTMRCPHCNVTLTMHKSSGRMECHYCGYTASVPRTCPQCGTADPAPMGFGTERVEERIAELFPEARVGRLDRDTSTSESAYNRIIKDFESGRSDILVGTQMITKGFDFGRVSVVGILNADNLLNSPDFRSSERAFQLMTQVAGRAGRRQTGGTVVIQTSEPENPVVRWVAAGDYDAMARSQLAERHAFSYPPYSRLVRLTLRDRDAVRLREGAVWLAGALRERFGRRVFGPVAPPVDRVREVFIVQIMLKIESGRPMSRARELLRGCLDRMAGEERLRQINVSVDVDVQ